MRLLEAYGLWNDRAWGEWLGALSGGLYIPFEISYLMHRLSVISVVVLAGNVFVASFLVFQLWSRLRKKTPLTNNRFATHIHPAQLFRIAQVVDYQERAVNMLYRLQSLLPQAIRTVMKVTKWLRFSNGNDV